jgi:hypothetical protein
VPTSPPEMVRDKVDAGTLPRDAPLRLWAGRGSGKRCSACEHPILPSEPEYEPRFDDGSPSIVLHAQCYELWLEELRRRGYLPSQ